MHAGGNSYRHTHRPTYIHTHTHIHTYIHTYVHTCDNGCIGTGIQATHTHKTRRPDGQAAKHTYTHSYIPTRIYGNRNTYIHTGGEYSHQPIHTNIYTWPHGAIQIHICVGIHTHHTQINTTQTNTHPYIHTNK